MAMLGRVVAMVLFGAVACGGATELTCGEGTVARDGECVVEAEPFPQGRPDGPLRCGPGTVERNGECVVADSPVTVGSGGLPGAGGESSAEGGSSSSVDLPPGATAEEVEKARMRCEQTESGIIAMAPAATVKQRLVGRWLLCGGSVLFGRNDTAGIRFAADGTWSFLLQGEAGALVDGQGFDNTGGWNVLDTGQTNLDKAGGGGDGTFLSFATTPPKLRVSATIGMSTYASLDF